MLLASKNRWLLLSFTLNIILSMFLIGWLIYDMLHLDIGWIRDQLANSTSFNWFSSGL